MPYGLLWSLAAVGVCTALALAPVRRPRRLALLSYGLGQVVNELPQLAAALVVASTALAIGQGDLHGAAGVVAVAVTAIVLVGLVVVTRRGLRARPEVDAAVRGALGEQVPAATVGAVLRTLLRPFPLRPRAVVRVPDRSYGPAGRQQSLDVYHHRSRPGGAPVLVYFHGGGYRGGSKHREARALLHRFAARGWVCISANYRLRPGAGFEEHLTDSKRVVAWAREHAHEYGADPRTLVAAGSSAGGHLSALLALTPNARSLQPGFESADTSVTAAIGFYGYYGTYYGEGTDERIPSTPLAYDARTAPPFFLVHGDNDTYVPVEIARALVGHLRSASAEPVVYAELPGSQHGFDVFRSVRYEAVLDGVEVFLDHVLTVAGRPRAERPDGGLAAGQPRISRAGP